jgi:hypothetical protein
MFRGDGCFRLTSEVLTCMVRYTFFLDQELCTPSFSRLITEYETVQDFMMIRYLADIRLVIFSYLTISRYAVRPKIKD